MEKNEITQDNFFLGTKCRFKGCKRPKRVPDYISYNNNKKGRGISSEYWYNEDKKGKYVIRCSAHWSSSNEMQVHFCKKISFCYWWLITNCKNAYDNDSSCFKSHCGKAYYIYFKKNIFK